MRDSRRTRLVFVLLLLVAFTLLTLDFRSKDSTPLTALRNVGSTVFGPIERGAAAAVEPIQDAVQAVVGARASQQRIESLRRENTRLRAQLDAAQLTQERSAELKSLMDLAGRGRYRIVPAEVIAVRSAQSFEHTATIDVGRRDGIERNMTVICAQGLAGRVVHVGEDTSTVLLAIDGSSHVGARMEGSDEIGVVHGGGPGQLQVELLDAKAPVRSGDRLVTFGSQGGKPYVAGVPIGRVTQVQPDPAALTLTATVEPFVDFTALDLVGVVVRAPKQSPRDALLPPRPTGPPTSESGGRQSPAEPAGAQPRRRGGRG